MGNQPSTYRHQGCGQLRMQPNPRRDQASTQFICKDVHTPAHALHARCCSRPGFGRVSARDGLGSAVVLKVIPGNSCVARLWFMTCCKTLTLWIFKCTIPKQELSTWKVSRYRLRQYTWRLLCTSFRTCLSGVILYIYTDYPERKYIGVSKLY